MNRLISVSGLLRVKITCPSASVSLHWHNSHKFPKMKSQPSIKRRGLLAGGNWLIDHVKRIDALPQPECLANIQSTHQSGGGSPGNVLFSLAGCGVTFPLLAAGMVGKDAAGTWLLAECKRRKIDTKHLGATHAAATGFTDVMTEQGGRRTFFHSRGASALWTGDDLNFTKLKVKHFHLGHLMVLDALDAADKAHGTKAAKLLASAVQAGVKTSVDIVSEQSERFAQVVPPALKFTDYLIINEHEAGRITGFKVRDAEGRLDTVTLRHAAGALLQQGVRELVVLHFPEGAFARTRKGEDVWQSSVKLPAKLIAGSVGAGDAFCAGFLLGVHEGWETKQCLETAVCVAAASLTDPTATEGIKSLSAALNLAKKYKFQPPLEPSEDF
jgi:sugar/nucleoside kinase (ribokinase family)